MIQITYEEVIQRLIDIGQRSDDNISDTRFITKYVMQQQKKDKLLELKTERIKLIDKSPYLNRYNMSFDTELVGKLLHIDDEIKALEEELK